MQNINCFLIFLIICSFVFSSPQNQNPLCAQWNGKTCTKCSYQSYFNNQNICQQIDPQCSSFDYTYKKCTKCYSGYSLVQGKCCKIEQNWYQQNPLCNKWDNTNRVCLTCAPYSYMNVEGFCQQVDPNCATYSNQNGQCLSCWKGYALRQGKCLVGNSQESYQQVTTQTTQQYDVIFDVDFDIQKCMSWANGKCLECAQGLQLDSAGKCVCSYAKS